MTSDREPGNAATGPPPAPAGSRLGWLFGVAALGGVIAVVLHLGDAARFTALLRAARWQWLGVGFALQAATYATEAGAWSAVLGRAGHPRPFPKLYALSVVALFTNQVVPTAGVAGTLVIVRAMERGGVPHAAAVSAVLVDLLGYYVAFGLAVGFALLVLGIHHDLSWLVLVMAAAIALLGVSVCGGVLWLTAPGRVMPAWARRWGPARRALASLVSADPALLREPRLLTRAALLRTGTFACDALTLWACLRAVGHPTPLPPVGSAFVVGMVAGTLGVVPGGLGTFEGGTLGGLALFGVGLETALAATLLYRGLSFWLPMVPGLWLGRRLARGGPR